MTAKWVLEVLKEPEIAIGVIDAAIHNFDRLGEFIGKDENLVILLCKLQELRTKIKNGSHNHLSDTKDK